MKSATLILLWGMLILTACAPTPQETPKQPEKVEQASAGHFSQVTAGGEYMGTEHLNGWLGQNPNKRVVSFGVVPSYYGSVDGFIVQFADGRSRHQQFEAIKGERLEYLERWEKSHPNVQIIAMATLPGYKFGLSGFVVCYEPK